MKPETIALKARLIEKIERLILYHQGLRNINGSWCVVSRLKCKLKEGTTYICSYKYEFGIQEDECSEVHSGFRDKIEVTL